MMVVPATTKSPLSRDCIDATLIKVVEPEFWAAATSGATLSAPLYSSNRKSAKGTAVEKVAVKAVVPGFASLQ